MTLILPRIPAIGISKDTLVPPEHVCIVFDGGAWPHALLICPSHEQLRRPLRLTARAIRVEGHPMQGDGCTQRNLIQLIRAVMLHPRFVVVADFLLRALKRRRQFRQNLYNGPFQ